MWVAEFFQLPAVSDPKLVFFSVTCSNRPSIFIIQTCIGFCPNNLHSLPEFMSTNCPDWGAAAPPSRTPMIIPVMAIL